MAVSWEQTGDLVRRSQGFINQGVDRGTTMLADRIEHYTNVAREITGVLREKGEPQAADAVEQLAARVQEAARYLRRTDGTTLLADTQDFARGRTWILAGVGFIGGLAAARAVRTAADGGTWESTPAYVDSYRQPETRYTQ